MKIYGRTTSFNVQKVLWLMDELKIHYEHIELGGKFGGLDDEKFAALTPIKKVPLLIDGQKIIWESHTILRYLASKYGRDHWYSDDPYQRSQYERWMDWSHTSFQPSFMKVFWGFYRTPESKRNMDEVNAAVSECVACLNILEETLKESDFISGPTITLADICAGAVLYRLTTQGVTIDIPTRVLGWYESLKIREGYKKWIMSDFSELRGRETF
ncbi:glutathione S-transferase family protein [Veronia pacifica]|uniref:Glutathione S-transferase n=1 Tax=Veronia pacifica TaxID=1080227 RepID=A0A1C3EIB0_9GAMM|nr:glutathione S-transferase family protein [Veronia pacifica]ODA32975.1 glutathione S-transferase [Veronia pacifica]